MLPKICLVILSAFVLAFGGRQDSLLSQKSSSPELPRVFLDTKFPTTNGAVINLPAGADFQAALDAAKPGDTIVLQAGAQYYGHFKLPKKSGSDWIVIRSSNMDELPPEGTRINPTQHRAAMPQLITPDSVSHSSVLRTAAGAHNYRFVGIEFKLASDLMYTTNIIELGDDSTDQSSLAAVPQDIVIDRCYIHGNNIGMVRRGVTLNSGRTAIIDSHISNIHGINTDTQAVGGWNGPGPYKVVNNYLEGSGETVMFGGGTIRIANMQPSDIEFRGNHVTRPKQWADYIIPRASGLSAAGAGISGAALRAGTKYYYTVTARGLVTRSVTGTSWPTSELAVTPTSGQNAVKLSWKSAKYATQYRVYRTTDPPGKVRSWVYYTVSGTSLTDTGAQGVAAALPTRATRWMVKNLLELKTARRMLIDGNVFENNWPDGQTGYALLFKANNHSKAPWSVVRDLTFTNNIVRHTASAINILGRDYRDVSEQVTKVRIGNNLFHDIGGPDWGGEGVFLKITETANVSVEHNTILNSGTAVYPYGVPSSGFVFSDNLFVHNKYGLRGDGAGIGFGSLNYYFPGWVFTHNVIVGAGKYAGNYPVDSFFPASLDATGFINLAEGDYKLSDSSPYKGAAADGKDVGADFDKVTSP